MTTRLELADGKYTLVREPTGNMHALRYGEPWRDLVGDNLIYWMAVEIERLQELLDAKEKAKEKLQSQLAAINEVREYAVTPLTQVCCGRPGAECCGDTNRVYPGTDDVVEFMNARCDELNAELAKK